MNLDLAGGTIYEYNKAIYASQGSKLEIRVTHFSQQGQKSAQLDRKNTSGPVILNPGREFPGKYQPSNPRFKDANDRSMFVR